MNAGRPALLIALALSLLVTAVGSRGMAEEALRFGRDVRPILSDKCYFCHGPDEENRAAGLRLDDPIEGRDAIDSGELLRRIQSDDPDDQMPPPEAKLALTDDERRVLAEWVEQGGNYENHWAFEPLPPSINPPVDDEDSWSRSAIDRFVWRGLAERGYSPAGEAAPRRWLRRVTFDLTGLPPTPTQVVEFLERIVSAESPEEAYAETLDELLASPAYGEHMAVAWLDAARYADSYGYQSDKLNTQWPYRDWVVQAFNDNLPYDKFLTWQLAGDLLEKPTRDQRLATAFNRLHRLNNEGGAVFEEWRLENVADRVHTFGSAVLGLTLECCRCHDHKYDPIPMRDYYALSAFFNSIDESGVYDRTAKVPAPSLLLPTKQQAQALAEAKQAVAEAEAAYRQAASLARQRSHQVSLRVADDSIPDLLVALGFDAPFNDDFKSVYHPSEGDRAWTKDPPRVPADAPSPRLSAGLAADGATDPPPDRRALSLDGERGVTLEGVEPFDRWTPFSVVVTLRETQRAPHRAVVAHHTRGTDCGYNGWDLTIVDGHLESRLYRVWPGNAIGVRTVEPIPVDRWHQVAATYDGSSSAAGLRLYLDGEPLATTVLRDCLKKSANVEVDHGGKFVLGQRFRSRGFANGLVDDLRIYSRDLTRIELRHLATGSPIRQTPEYLVSAVDEDARAARERLTAARKAMVMAEEAMQEIPVMKETAEPRETHVLARGAYDAETGPDTLVARATLSEIGPPLAESERRDRLALADWVTADDHPLTARVIVNRLWANFFGAGLVRTPENFGLQGELPSHPALLDWLARDFVAHGWDVKRLCRQIVLSATYRQESRPSPELAEADPENRWLGRGPAYRLAAEQIRDLALTASGLLNSERGGPPVSPYQPGGDLWKESNIMSPSYQQSVGVDLYRRSLYSVWKRTAPLPNMLVFDAQTREVCSVNRPRTNTPLQALVLLNDPQFVEAARVLAERSMLRKQSDEDRIAWAFLLLTGREPTDLEAGVLLRLLQAEREHYASDQQAAQRLTSVGDRPVAAQLDPSELAAMTVVCQAILNLDATVWKR
ncbi:MAG: DUF1553 domain-containing protein [Planctomycetota bacterium]